jgi:hypothetical protein
MRFSVRPSPKPAVDLPAEISFLSVLVGIPWANEPSWGRMSPLCAPCQVDGRALFSNDSSFIETLSIRIPSARSNWNNSGYDHVFAPLDPRRTKLIWIVEAKGFGVSVVGRLFAMIYNRNLDKAIPLLISEINAEKLR